MKTKISRFPATNHVLKGAANRCVPNWVAVTNGTPITDKPAAIGVALTNPAPQFFRLRGE